MSEMIIGTSAYPTADVELLRRAGIGWVRVGFGFPFVDRIGGELTEAYRRSKADASKFAAAGLKVLGITPLPGIATKKPDADGRLVPQWRDFFPAWCGPLGGPECLAAYEQTCRWLAEDLRGVVPAWQIANELDIVEFAGPLNPRQGCDLVVAAARGLKAADPSLVVGHNPAGCPKAYYFFGYLYAQAKDLLDYCGVDGYYGTWQPGGPADWAGRIAELHALTDRPILVNEWGFSSAGGVMTDAERASGQPVCQLRKWGCTWGPGHTPEGQARFVEGAFEAFRSVREMLLGVLFYRWEDQDKCWQCGRGDCPAETAWGLVDLHGQPKPAFDAFRNGAGRLIG